MTPLLVYLLAGAWVEVSFLAMVISVVKVVLIPVLLGIFDQLDLWKADSENIRSTSTDFCCIHRNDHQWNRICQCGKNLKLWSARTWSCGTSQSLRNGHRAWRGKTFTYRI